MLRVAWSLPFALAVAFLAQPAVAPASVEPRARLAELRPFQAGSSARFVPGEVIVRFEAGTRARARSAALRRHGAEVDRGLGLPGLAVARVAPESPPAVAAALEREPNVVYAEPNFLYQAAARTPNDPRFAELWGLHNASDADIDAPEAWDRTTGSSGVTVAVVDTGVAYNHPDLAPNIWTNAAEPENGVDDDGNGLVDDLRGWDFVDDDRAPLDYAVHGTHVAGTIGARGNNGLGVVGVSWDVKLMPLRAGDGSGGFAADAIAESFAYACAKGARVVNGSFGGPGFSQTLANAVNACPQTLFIFAAGNGGADGVGDDTDGAPTYPCAYAAANIICVAASGATDSLTSFSNYGANSVDLAAPGADILSAVPVYDTVFDDGFESALTGRWAVGGTGVWARTTEARTSGAFSVTDSPGAPYANNTSSWIATASAVDFASRLGCALEYELRLATELGFDGLLVEARPAGTSTWTAVAGWSGSTGGEFLPFAEDLSALDGDAADLRFRLVSDDTNVADGAHVDDLAVVCLRAGADGDYEGHDGTSMAAPHVAGVAALVLAANPGFSSADVRRAVLASVDRRAALTGRVATGGRLNAFGAVTGAVTPPPPPPPPPPGPPPPLPPPPAVLPDTVRPNTRITAGPARTTRARRVTFRFVSTEPGSTFRCRLDFANWRSCTSPRTYRRLKRGRHTFRVRARDRAGNFDVTPAVRTWRVR